MIEKNCVWPVCAVLNPADTIGSKFVFFFLIQPLIFGVMSQAYTIITRLSALKDGAWQR